jgi:hypothetical protein
VEGLADSGCAAGGHRPGARERRQQEFLRQSRDLALAAGGDASIEFFLPRVNFGWGTVSDVGSVEMGCMEWTT